MIPKPVASLSTIQKFSSSRNQMQIQPFEVHLHISGCHWH
nr:MAG TPA: hypothetical protein [Bacteriophage sp.]